ncbi:hypothetical protein ACFC36_35835 [Streptomyces rubiginosohelvolus]|uniref:hypothetical protein n=1 Tax=Streptomyces rubiginosohelvolus TaxID=67362 RepID=UPI0035E025D8
MNAASALYRTVFAVEAQTEYNALAEAQRDLIDQAVKILERDPRNERATRPDGPNARRAFVTPDLTIRYGVHRDHLVIAEINYRHVGSFLIGAE